MADAPEKPRVSNNLQTWLSQGEQLYSSALNDFRALEAQLDDLEQKLAAKQAEVNQIAQIIGKPAVEGSRRLSAQLTPAPMVVEEPPERMTMPMPAISGAPQPNSSNATIARALTGRFGR
jgi:hypothetical protein